MDARRNALLSERVSTIPKIRRSVQWTAARPSAQLHAALAAGWLVFLWLAGAFSVSGSDAVPELSRYEAIMGLGLFGTVLGALVVVGLALNNSRVTAPASIACGLSMIAFFATCGFLGHSASAWGTNAVFAGGLVMASVGIMARREPADA